MTEKVDKKEIPRLEVYLSRSELFQEDASHQVFEEGQPSAAAKTRLKIIRNAFEKDFLPKIIEECKSPEKEIEPLTPDQVSIFTSLVNSVTSEVGRAIVGLTVLQLSIKSIAPDQSIRLHKGGGRGRNFSWADGIPMRVLDKQFNTPALRKYGLLRLNADGVFMTRSLAENYPYGKLYKAAMRGARSEWLEIVELIEMTKIDPLNGLKHLIRMLHNRSEQFSEMAAVAMASIDAVAGRISSLDDAISFITGFVEFTTYSARVFEVALHSFFQVLEDEGAFAGFLKHLSQMRSANKKHGDIGDIELTSRPGNLEILESWDAKYGKPYLRDELEELDDKLKDHSETEQAGFVVEDTPKIKKEIVERIEEIQLIHDVEIHILTLHDWVYKHAELVDKAQESLAKLWIVAFAECLCQLRRERAPIDEPCDVWVMDITKYSKKWV